MKTLLVAAGLVALLLTGCEPANKNGNYFVRCLHGGEVIYEKWTYSGYLVHEAGFRIQEGPHHHVLLPAIPGYYLECKESYGRHLDEVEVNQ